MNRFRDFITANITRFFDWLDANQGRLKRNAEKGICEIDRATDRIARNITRLMIAGIIINVIASKFYPEFPERFPVIYGWYDGWLQFAEFIFKVGLNAIYSLFTGHVKEFWAEYNEAYREMLKCFVDWLESIHF